MTTNTTNTASAVDGAGKGAGDGAQTGAAEGSGDLDSGGTFLRCFGRQMKLLREAAGLTQAELGARVGYGEAQVGSVEQGRRIPKPQMIDAVDAAVSGGGVLMAMKGEVAKARYPSFARRYVQMEAEAVELHVYDTHIVNGLLQTEEYARAVFTMRRPALDEEVIEQRVTARLARQEILSKKARPLMSFVIEETVLHRPIGGESVLRAQLGQILRVGQGRNVEIQVMPTARADHAGLSGPFTLMETRDQRRVAYAEVASVSSLLGERSAVRSLEAQYGIIRAQALTPSESMTYIEQLMGVS